MEQPEDNNVDQPVSEVDDVQATEAPAEDAPAEQRADEEVEQQPTADADELAARAGGPDAAEEVPAVVEQEVVEEKEEGGFEAQQPEEPAAVEEVEQPSDETPESEETAPEPLAANEPEEQQLVSEPEEVADTDPAAAPLGEVDTGSSLTGDAEERAIPEPASASAPIEVEPELAAAVEEAFEEVEGEEGEPEPEYLPGEWYVVHTYAGYENKVKADLETRVASMNMEEEIYEVVIPMEDVVEIKGGKKQTVQRKVFPGYLLVRMELSDDSWYVVRNTPGVTGFVGSGTKPIPLSEKEVDKILKRKGEAEKPRPRAEWQTNDPVRVTTGPFANFQGVISEVDDERQKVKVLVNIFGRETPVELTYDQISKV